MPSFPSTVAPIVKRGSEVWFMPVHKDRNGDPIQNSAKGPYPKPRIEPVSIGIIHGQVRKTSYTDSDYKTQLNTVNSLAWRNWQPGQAWISRVLTEDVNENNVNIVVVDYIVRCCEYGWESIEPDLGYYYLDGGDPKVFVDTDGMPFIGALDGSGAENDSADDLVINSTDIKRAIDFNTALGF